MRQSKYMLCFFLTAAQHITHIRTLWGVVKYSPGTFWENKRKINSWGKHSGFEIGGVPHLRSDLLSEENIRGWFMESGLFRLKLKLPINFCKKWGDMFRWHYMKSWQLVITLQGLRWHPLHYPQQHTQAGKTVILAWMMHVCIFPENLG